MNTLVTSSIRVSSLLYVALAVSAHAQSGSALCWGSNQYTQCTPPAGLGRIKQIAAGDTHSIAIKQGGAVVCWGGNNRGQCSPPTNLGIVIAIAGGGVHTIAIKEDQSVSCWGAGTTTAFAMPNFGQSLVPTNLGSVTSVGAGHYHSIALQSTGAVVCWGGGATKMLAESILAVVPHRHFTFTIPKMLRPYFRFQLGFNLDCSSNSVVSRISA